MWPWTRDWEAMQGSWPWAVQFEAMACRAWWARVQHSPFPTCWVMLDSHQLATASEYLIERD